MKSKMKLFPWDEVAARADEIIRGDERAQVYQQWNCEHCGVKQTMPDANTFYENGICEECGKQTDIKKNGMNYMITVGINPPSNR
jgi:DNA-directed RNA polymerase subunit RPC12/RpoP